MTRARKIQWVGTVLLAGFVPCLLYNLYLISEGFTDSIFSYLISKPGMFDDFINPSYHNAGNNDPFAPQAGVVNSFPFHFVVCSFFARLPSDLAITLFLGGFLYVFFNHLHEEIYLGDPVEDLKNLLLFTCFSYPLLFALNRGNLELIVFLCVAYFIKLYAENRRVWAVVLLAVAIALKPFPVVFLALHFADRRYKEMVAVPLLAGLISLACYASFDGGLVRNLTLHLHGLAHYNSDYAVGNGGMTYGHSLFGTFKAVVAWFRPEALHAASTAAFGIYSKVMPLCAILTGLYLTFIEKVLWRRVALLVFMMNLFPFVSADYKLLHVYVPLFLLINRREWEPADGWFLVLLALLLVPKTYYYFEFGEAAQIVPHVVTSASLLNPLLMLVGYFGLVGLGLTEWYRRRRGLQPA